MKNNNNKSLQKGITKSHRDLLGMDVPKGYFSNSKEEILKAVSKPEKKTTRVFVLKPILKYSIAATVVIILGLTFFFRLQTKPIVPYTNTLDNTRSVILEEDPTLINSLFINNEEMDAFLDSYVMNEIMIKIQESELDFDNILINSLMIDDSSLDNYIDESLLENIVF